MTDGDGEAQPAPGPAEEAEVEEGDDSKEGEGAKDGEEAKDGVDGVDGEDGKKKKKEKKEKKAKVVKDEKMGQVKHEDLDWLFIGGAEDAKDREALEKHSIRYILNCTPVRSNGGVANVYEKDPKFEYCRVSMGDNATETLQSRMEASWVFLEKARIREDGSVLIHCQQGVSRSVSMAMSYMMKYYRTWLQEFDSLGNVQVALHFQLRWVCTVAGRWPPQRGLMAESVARPLSLPQSSPRSINQARKQAWQW
ncbi:unnamed protein product, partial [Effrenium voratum]